MCDLSALDEITACTARLLRIPNTSAALAATQDRVVLLALDIQFDQGTGATCGPPNRPRSALAHGPFL